MSGKADQDDEIKSPRSRSPVMGVTGLLREQSKGAPQSPTTEAERRASGGILRLDPSKPRRRSSATSMDFRNNYKDDPASPCPSDRLSVTWADGEKSISSETSMTLKGRAENLSGNPSLTTLRPNSTPRSPPPEFSPTKDLLGEPETGEDDLEASVSMILQRSASMRGSKKRTRRKSRRISTLTSSSVESDSEASASKVKVYREVLTGVKQQAWPIARKLQLARKAREFLVRHEGDLEERLAQSSSKKDVLYSHFIKIRRILHSGISSLYNWFISIELWQGRIKRIESHFGSAVASYFTFMRWVMGLNAAITLLLAAFVVVPETLAGDWKGSWERKHLLKEDKPTAFDLKTIWDFEGIMRYTPIFYGFYGKTVKTREGYRLPLAYILTSMCVYGYSFIAILRKMAANSRLSKLGDNDESVFTFKLFTGWDFTIGNLEAAQNKVAAINMSFRESLLEAKEAEKELVSWKITAKRCLAHFLFLCLLLGSAYAVILLVDRSKQTGPDSSWWRLNELTVVLTLISNSFPSFFELLGLLENNHPRKQLQWQLARIMILNLLNLYTLIFALFGKVDEMSSDLTSMRDYIESPEFLSRANTITPLGVPYGSNDVTTSVSGLLSTTAAALYAYKFTDSQNSQQNAELFDTTATSDSTTVTFSNIRSECRQIRVPCRPAVNEMSPEIKNDSLNSVEYPDWNVDSEASNLLVTNIIQNITDAPNSSIITDGSIFGFDNGINGSSAVTISLADFIKDMSNVSQFLNISNEFPPHNIELLEDFNPGEVNGSENFIKIRIGKDFNSNLTEKIGVGILNSKYQNSTKLSSRPTLSTAPFTDPFPGKLFSSESPVSITTSSISTTIDTTTANPIVDLSRALPGWMQPFALLPDIYDINSTYIWKRRKREATVVNTTSSTTSKQNGAVTENDKFINRDSFSNDKFGIPNNFSKDEESFETYFRPFAEPFGENVSNIDSSGSELRKNDTRESLHFENIFSYEDFNNNSLGSNMTTPTSDSIDSQFNYTNVITLNTTPRSIADENPVTWEANYTNNVPDNDYEYDYSNTILDTDLGIASPKKIASMPNGENISKEATNTNDEGTPKEVNTTFSASIAALTNTMSNNDLSTDTSYLPSTTVPSTYIENSITSNAAKFLGDLIPESTSNFIDNTEEYLHYLNSSIESDNECYEVIEVCNDTYTDNETATNIDLDGRNATNANHSRENLTATSFLFQPTTEMTTTMKPNPEFLAVHLVASNRTKLRKLCWETMFGQEIVKLIVMDLVITVVTIVIGDYIRAVVVRVFNNCCSWDLEKQFPGYPDFKIAENILHLVNNQGLVWMGMFFSPGLPGLNLAKLVILLYVRSWAVVTSNVPPETVFKASDNNNFYLALLLIMLFLCTLPVGYAVVWLTPSWHCGPFSDYRKIYQLATTTFINALPKWCEPIIDYISSPGVIIPGGLLLVLIIYYLMSLTASLREAVQDLKDQLRRERNEEKRKAQEARSGARVETPTTKWGRIMQLTPLPSNRFERKESDKNRSNKGADDKKPLLENEDLENKVVDSPIPDDVTDLGQSEVFDDSLSESKRPHHEAKPRVDKVRDASTQNYSPVYSKKSRRDSSQSEERDKKSRKESEERKKRKENGKTEGTKKKSSQESDYDHLPKSPRSRSKHRHNRPTPLEETEGGFSKTAQASQRDTSKNREFYHKDSPVMREHYHKDSPKRDSYHRDSPKIREGHYKDSSQSRDRHYRDSPKSKDAHWRRNSKEHHKDSPKKYRNGHRHSDSDQMERCDSGPKVTQPAEIDRIYKEYPELGDVFDSKQSLKDKQKKTKPALQGKVEEASPKRFSFTSKHKRDIPIVTLSEVHSEPSKIKKKESKKLKKENEIKEETPEMHTIPIIKISKEDSVERSIQQAKLERQEKTEEPRATTPQVGDKQNEKDDPQIQQEKELDEITIPEVQSTRSSESPELADQQYPLDRQVPETDSEHTSTTTTAVTSPITSPLTVKVKTAERKPLETDIDDPGNQIELELELVLLKEPIEKSLKSSQAKTADDPTQELSDNSSSVPLAEATFSEEDRPVAPEDLLIDPDTLEEYEKMSQSFEDEVGKLNNYEDDVGIHDNAREKKSEPRYRSRKPPKLKLPKSAFTKPDDDDNHNDEELNAEKSDENDEDDDERNISDEN